MSSEDDRRHDVYVHEFAATVAAIFFSQAITRTVDALLPNNSIANAVIVWLLFACALFVLVILLYGLSGTRSSFMKFTHCIYNLTGSSDDHTPRPKKMTIQQELSNDEDIACHVNLISSNTNTNTNTSAYRQN